MFKKKSLDQKSSHGNLKPLGCVWFLASSYFWALDFAIKGLSFMFEIVCSNLKKNKSNKITAFVMLKNNSIIKIFITL